MNDRKKKREEYEKDYLKRMSEKEHSTNTDNKDSIPETNSDPFVELAAKIQNDYPERFTTKKSTAYINSSNSVDQTPNISRTETVRVIPDLHKLTDEEVQKRRDEIEGIRKERLESKPYRTYENKKEIPVPSIILNAKVDDYYSIFGVNNTINCEELRAHFRTLTKKYNASTNSMNKSKSEIEELNLIQTRVNQAFGELKKIHCGGGF